MKRAREVASISWELALWSAVALILALWSTRILGQSSFGGTAVMKGDQRNYSWEGDDYPAYYPLEVREVIMFPEDTMHYPINGKDAAEQWETQYPTLGKGWVCLGPERRRFALTMYHELHCLGRLRAALEDGANRTYEAQAEHVQHCLNYLRIMTLCRADVTLEPVIDASLTVDITQPHLCRDWVQVYEEASRSVKQCMKHRT